MKHLTGILLLLICISAAAQNITHGPVFGAVTQDGCKVYLRSKQCGRVLMEISTTPDLQKSMAFGGVTDTLKDKSIMLPLSNLQPDTRYYYRILFEGVEDTIHGSFRTFPKEGAKGDYVFVTGSCQETENMKVFDVMPLHNPYFLMHSGDFTYPDYMLSRDYSSTIEGIQKSYRKRYNEKEMKQMLYNMPMDYVYDDDDYVGAAGGRYCINNMESGIKDGKVFHHMEADTFPESWRQNVIRGYNDYFPHYDLPDTSTAIHHSFKMGNAEFFVIDRNSNKPFPDKDAFKYNAKKNKYYYDPPKGWALFGKEQMDWLKEGLKNSKADWKFIVSGVPLNGACNKLVKAGLKIQNWHYKEWFGFHLATGFTSYWNAYPEERNDFMHYIDSNHLKNIVVISGDTHHCVMDDGSNAGLPELNASGLSVATTELAKYLKLIGNATGLFHMKKIWNKGGIGLSSKKCKNGFGKVRIVGDQYVELSIIDEDNTVISSFKVPFKK
ncbi:MAG: alkaline phosphatase D family protein [Chitinophagales bacterium]